ncbi:hypothetical protein LR48_Vigan08g058500 [Vigna angularis]|uniref:Bet v I/Major latex protein domain-containing protein n=2 Tax=Phaseolus angularis TaxID=3914 RepID=A0A0L9V411_PHAAN|nr:MLP-like protein 168 [Vigna angularis]KOM49758.1 hypothetical protein LR48_Vigan08g058500 [Vigna angularis]BAT89683.1 hypothetical protein VIGAN_06070600 [Vigna angularis var. angularis]
MTLAGKISIEIGVHATAAKWFTLYTRKLYHVQNLTDRIHGVKLHHGHDWHLNESIKQWTYTIEGKVIRCHESVESVDEANKRIIYKLFNGDIDHQFKIFKLIFQAIEGDGSAVIKWTIEYERVDEEVDPPYGYIECLHKCTRDIDDSLLKE